MLIYFHVVYGCFCTTAEWKSGNGNHTVSKFKTFALTLYRKCLQTLDLPTSSISCLQSSSLFPFRSLIYLPLLLSLYVFSPWATSLSAQSRWPDVPPKALTIGRVSPQHSSWVTAEWDFCISSPLLAFTPDIKAVHPGINLGILPLPWASSSRKTHQYNSGGWHSGLGHLLVWLALASSPTCCVILQFYNGLLLGSLNLVTW